MVALGNFVSLQETSLWLGKKYVVPEVDPVDFAFLHTLHPVFRKENTLVRNAIFYGLLTWLINPADFERKTVII